MVHLETEINTLLRNSCLSEKRFCEIRWCSIFCNICELAFGWIEICRHLNLYRNILNWVTIISDHTYTCTKKYVCKILLQEYSWIHIHGILSAPECLYNNILFFWQTDLINWFIFQLRETIQTQSTERLTWVVCPHITVNITQARVSKLCPLLLQVCYITMLTATRTCTAHRHAYTCT